MKCFWFVAFVILLLIAAGLWSVRTGLLEFGGFYSSSFKKGCEQQFYLPYPVLDGPLTSRTFSMSTAAFLMTVAYNVSISNCSNLGPFPVPPGSKKTTQIDGYSSDGIKRMFAKVIEFPDVTIVAFTGTEFVDEFVMDFEGSQATPTEMTKYQQGVLVHSGFWSIYSSLRTSLLSAIGNSDVIITGHSLGGALSTIASLDLPNVIATYTFASPRVFNPLGASLVNSFRTYNTEDIVPALPPAVFLEWEYAHPPTGGIPFTISDLTVDANHVDAYLQFFGV